MKKPSLSQEKGGNFVRTVKDSQSNNQTTNLAPPELRENLGREVFDFDEPASPDSPPEIPFQVQAMPQESPERSPKNFLKFLVPVLIGFILVFGVFLAWNYRQSLGLESFFNRVSVKIKTVLKNTGGENQVVSQAEVPQALEGRVKNLEEKQKDFATIESLRKIEDFLKRADTDADNLSDYDEVNVYKTDPAKKDTDGDGFDDKVEIENGFNPSGQGKMAAIPNITFENSRKLPALPN